MAVEARLDSKALEIAAKQMRHYMLKMSCPVGLLILPDEILIYRNRFTGSEEKSIDQIGRYKLGNAFQRFKITSEERSPSAKGRLFESFVQKWLEHLPKSDDIKQLSPELKEALEAYVLPALESGTVRASGPREHWSTL